MIVSGRQKILAFICIIICLFLSVPVLAQSADWEIVISTGDRSNRTVAVWDGQIVLVGDHQGTIYRSRDNGVLWESIPISSINFPGRITQLFFSGLGIAYANTINGRFYRSDDLGQTWSLINEFRGSIHSIVPTSDGGLVFSGNSWIAKTFDEGNTWISGIDHNHEPFGGHLDWRVSRERNGILFAVGAGCLEWVCGDLVRSSDGGNSWDRVEQSNQLEASVVLELSETGTLYQTRAWTHYLVRTNDVDLQHWLGAIAGAGYEIFDLVTIGQNLVFASGDDGVAISHDSGESWNHFGLAGYRVYAMALVDSEYLIAVSNSGIHRTNISSLVTSIDSNTLTHTAVELDPPRPNPFSTSTSITYSLPQPSNFSLELYDILGKRVWVLEEGFRATGEHEVQIDAAGLSAGIYFLRITAGEFSQTRKMVVVR